MKFSTIFYVKPVDFHTFVMRTIELDFMPFIGMSMDIDGTVRKVEDVIYVHREVSMNKLRITTSSGLRLIGTENIQTCRLEVYFEADDAHTMEDLRQMGWVGVL